MYGLCTTLRMGIPSVTHRGADSRALRQSFSVISGGQGLVAEDFEPLSLSPRYDVCAGVDQYTLHRKTRGQHIMVNVSCLAHHAYIPRSHSLNSEAETPIVMVHQQSLSGVVTNEV